MRLQGHDLIYRGLRQETRHFLKLAEDVRHTTGACRGMGLDLATMTSRGEGNTLEYEYRQEALSALLNKAEHLADLLENELKREFETDTSEQEH